MQQDHNDSIGPCLHEISQEGLLGFINGLGEVVVAPRFSSVGTFFEGLVWVKGELQGGSVDSSARSEESGFIDITGNFVIGPGPPPGFRFPEYLNFYSYGDFYEGRARFWVGDATGFGGYIDRSGKLVIPAEYASLGDFSDGLAWVSLPRSDGSSFGSKFTGFIDLDGNFVIPPDRQFVGGRFSCGRAAVSFQQVDHTWSTALMDRSGEIIIACGVYDSISTFEDGVARVVKDGKVGCIDPSGRVIVPVEFDHLWMFGKGEPRTVGSKDGMSFFIDTQGHYVPIPGIGPEVEMLGLREGRVRVETGGKQGFLDDDGNLVIPIVFDSASDFRSGLAFAEQGVWKGYINRQGDFVWRTDEWDEPVRNSVSKPLSDFLPPGTVAALPLEYNWGGVANAIVFASSGPLDSVAPWLAERYGDFFEFSDDSTLPGSLDLVFSNDAIDGSIHLCERTREQARWLKGGRGRVGCAVGFVAA
jgi:hypothetical protein